jgi:hypothetical protein
MSSMFLTSNIFVLRKFLATRVRIASASCGAFACPRLAMAQLQVDWRVALVRPSGIDI